MIVANLSVPLQEQSMRTIAFPVLVAVCCQIVLPELFARERKQSFPPRAWGEEQATGRPNTKEAGDKTTAWASAEPDGQDEWLELEYAEEVMPVAVLVYETFNPGALFRVCGFTASGMEAELWSGEDPTPRTAAMGVSEVKVDSKLMTRRVRIYLKSKEVPGWNEIDAVGLKDASGKMHWAIAATASSCFAGPRPETSEGEAVLPEPESDSAPAAEEAAPAPRVRRGAGARRDARIEQLEREVAELRRLVEELRGERSRADD
jgi:hypothetical protein